MTEREAVTPNPPADDWRGYYVERADDGSIKGAYRQPQPGLAEEALAEGDAALAAYLAAPALAASTMIPYAAFRARWTAEELQALFAVKTADWRVEDYVNIAVAQNAVNLSSPTTAAAKALFVANGVLTAERADLIFAADAG